MINIRKYFRDEEEIYPNKIETGTMIIDGKRCFGF